MAKRRLSKLMQEKAALGEVLLPQERLLLPSKKDVSVAEKLWLPESKFDHTPEFVAWINSMLYGRFSDKVGYAPFEMYKKQAESWLSLSVDYHSMSAEDRFDFHFQEYERISTNTYYFANRYAWRRDEAGTSGEERYVADEHHIVLFFLIDCGYSFMLGKGRQIGATTCLGIANLRDMLVRPNYFCKYICQDDSTGQEIFDQKIKWPYAKLPVWMRPTVSSSAMDSFRIGKKNKQGGYDAPNSLTTTIPPSTTAINGGSPSRVLIDEIGEIPMLTAMLAEGRPTLYTKDAKGNYVMARQVIAWGTGGKMVKGKGAYKNEWYTQLSLWEDKAYHSCMIPIFFSWDCKFTQEEYDREKLAYYGGSRAASMGVSVEETKIQFHQHYPTTFEDMFTSSSVMIMDRVAYEAGVKRCRDLAPATLKYGNFVPIYDQSIKFDGNSYVPFKIIGAEFVPCDPDKAMITMRRDVQKSWKHRYYQGTDPIQDNTGSSKFSSTVLDKFDYTPACLLNFRKDHDPKITFLQSLLMGMYYATGGLSKCPELVEANIGTSYIEFVTSMGYGLSIVFNTQLPIRFMGGARMDGIDNHGHRAELITSELAEYMRVYHEAIEIPTYFTQIATFEQKQTSGGKITWATKDHRYYQDDTLYSLVYSYICTQCFPHDRCEDSEDKKVQYQIVQKLYRNSDGSLVRKATKVPVA